MTQHNRFMMVLVFMVGIFLSGTTPNADAAFISNFQSAFRTAGPNLDFDFDFLGWDGGTEVVPTEFVCPGADFTEFGAWGGGSGGSGLGLISVVITRSSGAVGTIYGSFHAYFDLEVVGNLGNTYFNEYGEADILGNGVNPNVFEIDEPGYTFGDILFNFGYGDLDNFNNVPSSSPDDVAVALGWEDFSLAEGETATITLVVSDVGSIVPSSSFSLRHIDPDSKATITFSGTMDIKPIPEPGTLLLLGTGLAGLAGYGYRFRRKKKA